MTETENSPEEKSIFLNGTVNTHVGVVLLSILIIAATIYLTNHYFEIMFPEKLTSGRICDFTSFFNCDSATYSKVSNIFGVPIALYGLLIGIFVLSNYMTKSVEAERTLYFILTANFMGCLGLLVYSLAALGSLCPFCTLYYILSGLLLLIFYKKSSWGKPSVKFMAIYGVITLASSGVFAYVYNGKVEKQKVLAKSLISQYNKLDNLGKPAKDSPFRIASSTEKFEDAPIQMSIFSDFQCPACKALSDMMHPLKRKYKGKINIQYYYYPLDSACNSQVSRPIHPLACKGAYLTTCLKDDFVKVHDDIFENQRTLSYEWIRNYAKKKNVLECIEASTTREQVVDVIAQSEGFNVKSTPTFILNGVKIEGALPLNQMYILMDELLKRSESK